MLKEAQRRKTTFCTNSDVGLSNEVFGKLVLAITAYLLRDVVG
jgi:hypothetical protein